MSKNNDGHTPGLIESAMDRLARKAPDEASDLVRSEPPPWWQDFDQADTSRQRQWQTAPGNEDPAASALLHKLASALAAVHSRPFARGAPLLFGAVLAFGGAGLVWRPIGNGNAGSSESEARATPPAIPIASPAPVATVEPLPAAALPVDVGEAQARDLIEHWRQDWVSRNVEGYLGWYSPDFLPANGQTRSAWAAARRKKLSSQSDISLQVHDLRFERIDRDRLKAVFLQDYASGTYRESARLKTLVLIRAGGDWRIAGEWQGTPPASRVDADGKGGPKLNQ